MNRTWICTVFFSLLLMAMSMPVWAQENQIVNSEFDDGTNGWGRYGTAGYDWGVVQGIGLSGANAAVIDVTDASATTAIGISQGGLLLEPGVTYPIGFTARAGQDREMVVLLQTNLNGASWPTQLEQKVELTPNAETYVLEYTHTGDALGDDATETVTLYLMLKGVYWPMEGDDLDTKVWIDRVYFGAVPPLPRRDLATDPDPADETLDVWRDTDLGWTAGAFAQTHDVYLGTSLDDVNAATRTNPQDVLLSQGQDAATCDPGRLDFGQTYYWRVDEVNGPPDNAVVKGAVWSFTTEPSMYAVADVIATSNALSAASEGPVNAVNGSGLDANDQHSTTTTDMWLGSPGDDPLHIQFAFDRVCELHEMLVWNYNAAFELFLGFGLKDVTVEYSPDGVEWISLGDVEFAQAPAQPDYAADTVVDFGGVAVRYVRLTVNSGWGTLDQYGLSEVRFLYVPAQARAPEPSDGAADVDVATSLVWRPGRYAAKHEVFLGADQNAVAEGLAAVDTVTQGSYSPDNLEFGRTYYWKVNEVNETEAVTSWEGNLWSFATQQYVTIDDFEGYDDDVDLIYDTWIDGWVNGSGSVVGHLQPPFAEIAIVHGGAQSMPLEYNNAQSPFYSEASRMWTGAQDWTVHGADSLRLHFYGDPDNAPDRLYIAIEDSAGQVAEVGYDDVAALAAGAWQEWLVPLSGFGGVDLTSVTTVFIGVGDRNNPAESGVGTLYMDDIELGRSAAANETTTQ